MQNFCRDVTAVAQISPRSCHDVCVPKSWWDCGKVLVKILHSNCYILDNAKNNMGMKDISI